MSKIKSNCTLCRRVDVLYKNKFTTPPTENTLSSIHKNLYRKESVAEIQLCTICAYKVELSSDIMKKYDEASKRKNTASLKNCFFCENNTSPLIELNDNPNEVQDKIAEFICSARIKRIFKDSKSCLKCIYGLCIWYEVRTKLFEVMDISTSTTTENNNESNTIGIEQRTPQTSRTLRKSPRKLQRQSEGSTVRSNLTNHTTDAPASVSSRRSKKGATGKSENNNYTKANWYKCLTETLQKFQTVDKLKQSEKMILNVPEIEDNQDKLFNMLPFVEICMNSQISKDRILQDNSVEIPSFTISDSESEAPTKKKKEITRTRHDRKTKRKKGRAGKRIRFKLPMRIKKKLPLVTSEGSSNETISIIDSDDESENSFLCNVCDKSFTVKCDFLAHRLKHERLGDVVINVLRHKLPGKLNIADLSPKPQLKGETASPENINRLLTKWIGEHAAKIYAEAAVNSSVHVDNVNEKEIDPDTPDEEAAADEETERSNEKIEHEHTNKSYDEIMVVDNDQDANNAGKQNDVDENTENDRGMDIDAENSDEIDESAKKIDANKNNTDPADTDKTENQCESQHEEVVQVEKDRGEVTIALVHEEQSNRDEDKEQKSNDPSESKDDTSKEQVDFIAPIVDAEDGAEPLEEDTEDIYKDLELEKDAEEEVTIRLRKEVSLEEVTIDLENEVSPVEVTIDLEKEVSSEEETIDLEKEVSSEEVTIDLEKEVSSEVTIDGDKELRKTKNEGKKLCKPGEKEKDWDKTKDEKELCKTNCNLKNDTNDTKSETTQSTSTPSNEGVSEKSQKAIDVDKMTDDTAHAQLESNRNDKVNEFDEFENTGISPPVMTCEDLLNILETNIDSDTDTNEDTTVTVSAKRKRETEPDEEPTPKKKKVRFADEKEIFTPEGSGVLFEKIIENDQFIMEDELALKES